MNRLGVNDAPLVQGLYDACADYFLASEGTAAPADSALSGFFDVPLGVGLHQKRIFGVPAGDGSLVAMCESLCGYPEAAVWYIGLLLVHPAARGAGVGARFVRELFALALDAGCDEVRLCVFDFDAGALCFWQKQGFVFGRVAASAVFGGVVRARTELVCRDLARGCG